MDKNKEETKKEEVEEKTEEKTKAEDKEKKSKDEADVEIESLSSDKAEEAKVETRERDLMDEESEELNYDDVSAVTSSAGKTVAFIPMAPRALMPLSKEIETTSKKKRLVPEARVRIDKKNMKKYDI